MSRNNRSKLAIRILCGFLAILMILGGLVSVAYLFIDHAHAADYPADLRVHVGLKYGSTMLASYTVTSSSGFSVVNQNVSTRSMPYTELFETSHTQLIVAAAQNLVRTGDTYYGTTAASADIGGYSLQSTRQFTTYEQAEQYITKNYAPKLEDYSIYVAYESATSRYRVRIGTYTTEEAAKSASSTVRAKIGDALTIVMPGTSVYLIDPVDGSVLFAYGDGTETCLGLCAASSSNEAIVDGKWYDGTVVFKCATYNGNACLRFTNAIDLEPYVERVVDSEIYASWPLETQKAFAIAVRTYTIANLNKHSRYGFDLCATTDCHVYSAARIYDLTHRAVSETAGQVISYEGRIASIYYSSSTGGVTVSAEEAFGPAAAKPYLTAIKTPWEKYTSHSNGFWRVEVTPEQLAKELRNKGYTAIKDAVEEIRILQFAKNSTYVYQLEVTDIHGNTIVIERSDSVRLALSTYLKSANFVVGRGSVLYTTDVDNYVVEHPEAGLESEPKFTVETADGRFLSRFIRGLSVIHSEGYSALPERDAAVITAQNVHSYVGDMPNVNADYETYYATDPNNFVFVGKGWGHGVGMSQWGLKDMGDLHYTYDQMLAAYFPSAAICHFTELH